MKRDKIFFGVAVGVMVYIAALKTTAPKWIMEEERKHCVERTIEGKLIYVENAQRLRQPHYQTEGLDWKNHRPEGFLLLNDSTVAKLQDGAELASFGKEHRYLNRMQVGHHYRLRTMHADSGWTCEDNYIIGMDKD